MYFYEIYDINIITSVNRRFTLNNLNKRRICADKSFIGIIIENSLIDKSIIYYLNVLSEKK